jgi:hypothetical protein
MPYLVFALISVVVGYTITHIEFKKEKFKKEEK